MNPERALFEDKIRKEKVNFKTGKSCYICGGRDMVFSAEDMATIAEICSQEEIYDLLFKRRFEGRPYTIADAEKFITWLKQGWVDDSYFVFLIRNDENKIIGAIDIKSADLESAEVGYWADKNEPGFMTAALEEIVVIAKNAGYKKLWAKVLTSNNKSIGVLERNQFQKNPDIQKEEDREYYIFEKIL